MAQLAILESRDHPTGNQPDARRYGRSSGCHLSCHRRSRRISLVTAESLIECGPAPRVDGRKEPSKYAQSRLTAWEESGIEVRCVQGDVSQEPDVKRILSGIQTEMPSLRE